MTVPTTPRIASRPGAPRGALVFAVTVGLCAAIVMAVRYRYSGFDDAAKDGGIWYEVGRRVLTGQPILHLPHYRYPPAFAVLISPLCLLPPALYYWVWFGLNTLFFFLSLRFTRRLSWWKEGPPPSRAYWLPAILVMSYALDNLFLGQVNLLITALLYLALTELARDREWTAGLALGATIAMKVFTLPCVVYLLYRRRWRAAVATLLTCAALLLLLPAPVRGFSRNLHEVTDWGRRVVVPYLTRGEAGDWGQHGVDLGNQSLQAVLHRLFTSVNAGVTARHERLSVRLTELPKREVDVLLLVCLAALAAVFGWACGWRTPLDRRTQTVEFGLCATLLLLASALAWTYFYVMLLLPVAVALGLLYDSEGLAAGTRRWLVASLWAQALVVPLMERQFGGAYFRAAGSICWASLLLYLALARAAHDLRSRGPV